MARRSDEQAAFLDVEQAEGGGDEDAWCRRVGAQGGVDAGERPARAIRDAGFTPARRDMQYRRLPSRETG